MTDQSEYAVRDYFQTLGALIPDFGIEYEGVDTESWTVQVRTADGVIGLDQLSSGVLSVMGWIGVLLERLQRAYPESTAPRKEPALAIVDEIDLHLHPAWQRQLVPLLRNTFPKVQFVWSTHSPLVVGSLADKSRVVQITRHVSGDLIVESNVHSFAGLRADQILTGPTFDLESTRSQATETALDDYSEAFAAAHRQGDSALMSALNDGVEHLLAAPGETPERRKAEDTVRRVLLEEIRSAPREDRERVAAEVMAYLESLQPRFRP